MVENSSLSRTQKKGSKTKESFDSNQINKIKENKKKKKKNIKQTVFAAKYSLKVSEFGDNGFVPRHRRYPHEDPQWAFVF